MSTQKKTILIAEDEAELLEICTDIFELENFNVLGATDGEEALNLFLDNHVDLILSDSHMPNLGGLELLEKIISSEKEVPPFFLLTGDVSLTEDLVQKKGGSGLIPKPFDMDEILKEVSKILVKDKCAS